MPADQELLAAAVQVDVIDLVGRIIANPDRAMVSLAAKLALALAVETTWAVCLEADLLVRALALPVTGDDDKDAARDAAIQHQAKEISRLMAAIRGETTKEENDGSCHP